MTSDAEWEQVIAQCGATLLETGSVRIHVGAGRTNEQIFMFSQAIAEWCGLNCIDIARDDDAHIILTQADERKWAARWN